MDHDSLKILWNQQAQQQAELGMSPRNMSAVDRAKATTELVLGLHEEATELAKIGASYKRHILRQPEPDRLNVADAIADILKLTLALAQLHDLSLDDVYDAFLRKTEVVRSRAEGERTRMERDTKLICVDMDDVIADLSGWTAKLEHLKGGAPANDRTWALMESYKDEFYKGGGFRELPAINGAQNALTQLKADGWTIVIVTARPQWQYKRLYADTLWWLNKRDIPHDLILFNKDKVEAVYQHLSPAWPRHFIEDHPKNAIGLADAGMNVVLFDQPHNRAIEANERIHRVVGWDGVLEHVK
jgi:uncharacterized HAD superfamily protein/NTP pyrophosphatase (non-canonical NTP hydrolase)